MNKRPDRLTELLVDAAINIAAVRGTFAGAQALAELGVPIEVAHRVLLQPGRRRGSKATIAQQLADLATNLRKSIIL